MDNMRDNVVIITSVIYFKNKRLSYIDSRSTFTPEERLEQTKKTIQSIRSKIPNAKILFLELGIKDIKNTNIIKDVDKYIYLGNKYIIRLTTDSKYKGLGESVGLLLGSFYIPKNTKRFFKISGRYYLNDNFNLRKWGEGNFLCKKINKNYISTRFYSFSKKIYLIWRLVLFLSIPFMLLNRSIENIMYYLIPNKYIKFIDIIGVSGIIGVDKNSKINE